MSRYQFASIMMLLWGILGRLDKGSAWSTGAHFIGFLYAAQVLHLMWKHRNDPEAP